METKLSSIFKTARAIMLAKTFLESPFNVLQGSWKWVIFKQSVEFLEAGQFQSTLTFKLP